jgi:hypothetical protein
VSSRREMPRPRRSVATARKESDHAR